MLPRIEIVNGKPEIVGEFNFELSDKVILDRETLLPYKKISFNFCVETILEIQKTLDDKEIVKAYAEKLKEDFINYTLNGN